MIYSFQMHSIVFSLQYLWVLPFWLKNFLFSWKWPRPCNVSIVAFLGGRNYPDLLLRLLTTTLNAVIVFVLKRNYVKSPQMPNARELNLWEIKGNYSEVNLIPVSWLVFLLWHGKFIVAFVFNLKALLKCLLKNWYNYL